MTKPIKQVIVIRKDLKMRRGKEIAQGAHASMAFLARRLREQLLDIDAPQVEPIHLSPEEQIWILGSFAKICVRVNSELELMDIYQKAKEAGLEAQLIIDSGRTEFEGVPTKTCLAIGPDDSAKIDLITGSLELY